MTKERLKKYMILKRETDDLKARVDELEARAGALRSPSFNGLPSAPGKVSSPVEDTVVALVDLQSVYVRRLETLLKEQKAVEEAIASLSDSVLRKLMRVRYLDGLTWEEVCDCIGYSWSQTHRLHAQALIELRGEDE